MARLNEPPAVPQPSADSIDTVKRRFLRQNRELAKINSQQSIRIRSLENDCSRLLAENLSLQENVLQLQNEMESRPALDQVDSVAMQLEATMQELGSLVAGITKLKKSSRVDKRRILTTARRRNGERQWRSGLGLQEVENGMLPTITEDKFFPGRMMNANEMQDMFETESQSPDLGPPPVSRFESDDPISFGPNSTSNDQPIDCEDDEAALPVNLETRKKRRESGPKFNIRRVSVIESPDEGEEGVSKATRTGSKRKFSVREDEEKDSSKVEPFRFSRRGLSNASEVEGQDEVCKLSSPPRPILSAKPVNTDPVVSPKKQRSNTIEKDKPERKLTSAKPQARARLNITRNTIQPTFPTLEMPEPIPTADVILEPLHPKTPAVEDIFSPPSTEPSTQRLAGKDTPPPGDLTSSDQTGQVSRPGRRARPQVSYKEPSLAAKMRRPDAKMVDAVVDRRTSVGSQIAPSTVAKNNSEDISWKPLSTVAVRRAEEEAEVGSPLRQKLDRQDNRNVPAQREEECSSSSKAISALISETSTAKRKPTQDSATDQETSTKDENNLAIFDFSDSPPPASKNAARAKITDLAKSARNARRHSNVPGASSSGQRTFTTVSSALHKRSGSGNVKVPASPPSACALSKSSSLSMPSVKEKKLDVERDNIMVRIPVRSVSSTSGAIAIKGSASKLATGTDSLRAERAASRRKSMML